MNRGMVQEKAKVLLHRRIARDHYRMRLKAPSAARGARPGQFIHIRCREEAPYDPLLRRPISLVDVDPVRGTLDIVYKVMGLGTRVLAQIPEGSEADFIGPLGEPFIFPPKGKRAVLIGGGVGIPPMVFLAKELVKGGGWRVKVFLGARTREWVICREDFRKLGVPVHAATDDGTLGYKGSVVNLFEKEFPYTLHPSPPTALYICGPTGMMKAAAAVAGRRGIPAQVSLEERMGCAMGCCMGCVVEVNTEPAGSHARFQRVCTEGPVFAAEAVLWR